MYLQDYKNRDIKHGECDISAPNISSLLSPFYIITSVHLKFWGLVMNDFSFCLFSNTDTAEIDYRGELITDLDTERKAR